MPPTLDKCLTAFAGALAMLGVILFLPMLFPSPDDRHGGMFAAMGGMVCVGAAAWVFAVVLAFRRRWWVRWLLVLLPAVAFGVVATIDNPPLC